MAVPVEGTVVCVRRTAAQLTGNLSRVQLKNSTRLAEGNTREIYQHPHANHLLIKVMRFHMIDRRWGYRKYLMRRSRYRYYQVFHREIETYLAIKAKNVEHPYWLRRIDGFVDTDLGLGMVVEKLTDRDGKLAPTLPRMIAEGRFTDEIRNQFEMLLQAVSKCEGVTIARLRPKDVVCAHDPVRGYRLVLVDGLGDHVLVPLRKMFAFLNRRHLRKRLLRLKYLVDQAVMEGQSQGHKLPV